ncbi:variant erythrocyte surface antigen-1 family protein [Babesia caballi]|uniref:Variant erythrocyte surface antigen-1 family protein n=1 Tax=Babesia caballi TaxID=5871 RepID=A0AAV4LMX5_BABCB|nr:variant erythrocyte surface antigen-1 family protein [Babesia caballi]
MDRIQVLLKDVEKFATGLSQQEFEHVKKALTPGTTGLIAKLVDGLQQFIGYQTGSNTNGLITGAGIAASNMATHRLCDATIAFTIGVLEECKKKVSGDHKSKLDGVITKLHAKYGTGPDGLKAVAAEVKSQLKDLPGGVRAFLNDIGSVFEKNLNDFHSYSNQPEQLAQKVGDYLKGIFTGSWGSSTGVDGKLKAVVSAARGKHGQDTYDPNAENVSNNIGEVQNAITPVHPAVNSILTAGKSAFMAVLKMPNYTRMNYNAPNTIQWNSDSDAAKVQACAKIFLGCLPLYYQALTYIYWGCHDNGGKWRNQTLANGAMRSYFDSQGLLPTFVDRSKRGAHIAESALKGFTEFTTAASSSLRDYNSSYVSFTKELQEKVKNAGQVSSTCPLSALYNGASCYFRYQQTTTAKSAGGTPKTIREMLYFLAALQFSPQYDAFDGYVTEYFRTVLGKQSDDDSELKLQVADSSETKDNNTLSSDQLKDYLRASCSFSSSVLGMIQGPGATEKSEPWLFELFCNSAFQFKYPSGPILFSTVSNYAYALQFQLLFLYYMCGNVGVKCGWQDCTYGKEMKPNDSDTQLSSHICQGLTCGGKDGCNHNGTRRDTNCKHSFHANNNKEPTCGKGSNPSPLQAFITGALPSFNLSSSSTPNHMSDHPQGALCHTPMGFQANHLRRIGNGAVVYLVLKPICGNFSSPLRQLCEKLGCLTKRTPRTLGDMFGFTWHLKGQLFPKSSMSYEKWLPALSDLTPFSSTVKDHLDVLKTFVGSSQTHSNSHDTHDLKSLSNYGCNQFSKNCGPYLSPLTLSNGATFGKPAPYASTYLSWMVYLTDDLVTGFQELLDEFKNIDCSQTGCRKSASGNQQACTSHKAGTHGIDTNCKCDSVVHCGGTLPLLYRHGFTFGSTGDLFGEGTNGTNTKRTCANFHSQLLSVISGNPLSDLLTSIDEFLFLFRYYFLYNQSASWTIYICLILYTFFFLLDTLHLHSHLKLTSSHTILPLALLTSSKPLPITKLTYIGQ